MDYNKFREALKGLIDEKSSKEDIDKIASISKMVDDAEQEDATKKAEHEKLKTDYIDMVKEYGFKDTGTPKNEDKPATLEDIANAIVAKRSDRALHR